MWYRFHIQKNHIVFEFDNTIVVSRLIEGEYFRIDQMLSNDYETKVRINKKRTAQLYRPCNTSGKKKETRNQSSSSISVTNLWN